MGFKWHFILLILVACQNITGNTALENNVSAFTEQSDNSELLFIAPDSVREEQTEFVEKLRNTGHDKRQLYEEYLGIIGANGVLAGIETVWPKCHNEAHDLGKIIFAKIQNIEQSLRICRNKCLTGCMHGVLMEAFMDAQSDEEEGHIDLDKLKPLMKEICFNNSEMTTSYGPGECAHGVGHAIMFLSGYDIADALQGCAEFDDKKMEYYCATGGYMEYTVERDKEDAKTRSIFYPCDTFDHPAACARGKVGLVATQYYRQGKDLEGVLQAVVQDCEQLIGKFRRGCFHGIGNAYSGFISSNTISIQKVCSYGSEEEQIMCIEGAMQYMGKYASDKTAAVCEQLEGEKKEICLTAAGHKLYSMEADLALYFKD